MTDFEALRDMGAFTEDMFNRIIAFQEREHPAWNPALPFTQRLQALPLHNLIFSNPDRDPAQFGPTVAPYFPLREEMQKIANYVAQTIDQQTNQQTKGQQSGASATLLDLFPGNGFIGSLIGREGVKVIGLQHAEIKPNQIPEFYDAACFEFSDEPVSEQRFDAALISWPPSGLNPTELLTEKQAKLLIYIFTDHVEPHSGLRQTGTADMFAKLDTDYVQLDAWQVERPKDLLHEIWPDMTPSIEEIRQVRIYGHRSVAFTTPKLIPAEDYPWEKDLQMALLALQAKREMQSRGFPV